MLFVLTFIFIWFVNNVFANETVIFTNITVKNTTCRTLENLKCKPGIVLPVWKSADSESKAVIAGKAFVYLVAMFYFFLGISIISDIFMSAIEIITSKEKEVLVRDRVTGKKHRVTVKIWNETVANLTLMALGSSAPEILLSVIEVIGQGFKAGELGPSTIVGSAAFNLFMITAVCVVVLPPGEVRRIKHIKVFAFTASCSMFAYIWLYLILSIFSPGVIEIWEGIITFLCFPAMVIAAWAIDRKISFYHLLRKKIRKVKKRGQAFMQTGDGDVVAVSLKSTVKHDSNNDNVDEKDIELLPLEEDDDPLEIINDKKKIAMEAFHRARTKYPDADSITLKKLIEQENIKLQHKSRAFYRVQATHALTGQGNLLRLKDRNNSIELNNKTEEVSASQKDTVLENCVQFEPDQYTVVESCGQCFLTVKRFGNDLSDTLYVDYETSDGTANEGDDYLPVKGTLEFKPNETIKKISITIIDDDLFELDEHFYCKLTAIRYYHVAENTQNKSTKTTIGNANTATIIILDDDYPGIFTFEHSKFEVMESVGVLTLRVLRLIGARGKVSIPYQTVEGSAFGGGADYEDSKGEIEFFDDETIKTVDIPIVNREEYEKAKTFTVVLGEPKIVGKLNSTITNLSSIKDDDLRRVLEVGKPTLGDHKACEIKIVESKEFKKTIDQMLSAKNKSILGSNSWTQQFKDAFQVEYGGDEEESDDVEPTYGDYVMHYLSFFWKVLFACVPPTDICGGWACFTASIIMIGILTAITGDIASHFGCTVGLADSVVAISFVALGTSLPDTFASKVATINDEHADGSIGNITGSNSVNVFLGIGLAWSIAAIYHASNGNKFEVDPGSLGFSVMLFCIEASVCIGILMYRRSSKNIRAELGGPAISRYITFTTFLLLWIIYLLVSGLESYCYFTLKF
ncbi:sodium/calcium exchanger 1 isoform X2 [Hydra vulgaris]|uniref:Sodium/calcium exchanger 1 isoform X2 n=1 Tax=Hydra vulgaris TaxID=6087 RepID=A0ABM4CHG0_HYDVU